MKRSTAVFRILQEILTNVLRHAQATNLYVKLSHTRNHFELEVKDDGRGITESQTNQLSVTRPVGNERTSAAGWR